MNRLVLVCVAVTAISAPLAAQSSPSPSATDPASRPRIIVGWRHFGTPRPADSQTASNIPQPSPAPPARDQVPNVAPNLAPDHSHDQPPASEPEQNPGSTADQVSGGGQVSDSTPAPSSDQPDQPSDQQPLPPAAGTGSSDTSGVTPAAAPPISDKKTDNSTAAKTSPEENAASKVAEVSADYAKREQDREARRQELEAAAHNDPSVQGLANIQATRLMLEGEQDRMQSSAQLAKAFSELAAGLQSDTARVKSLLATRRQSVDRADAEIARISAETPELNVALKNLALLPAGSDNDDLMRSLARRLDQDDEIVRSDRQRTQEARDEVKGLEADEQELMRESAQAKAKAASFTQASQDAKVNQGLLADRLEFSVQRKRAADEVADTSKILGTSVNMRGHLPSEQAPPGDQPGTSAEAPAPTTSPADQPEASAPAAPAGAVETGDTSGPKVESLRDCIRRSGDVAACRASAGGGQP